MLQSLPPGQHVHVRYRLPQMLHRGYYVWVACDSLSLPEYAHAIAEEDNTTITCYIPSEIGKCFVVNCKDGMGQHHFAMEVHLDGQFGGRSICLPGSRHQRTGLRTSRTTMRPYQFADLVMTDTDADDDSLLRQPEELGTIKALFRRVLPQTREAEFRPTSFSELEVVSEKSKMVGKHRVSLGEEREANKHRRTVHSQPLDPNEGYYATFVFRYRPLAMLQAQGIAPPPEPEMAQVVAAPSEVDGEVQSSLGKRRPRYDDDDMYYDPPSRSGTPSKKPRLSTESETVKVESDDEDLDELKTTVQTLQAQLKRMEGKIERIERGRGSESKTAPRMSLQVKKEDAVFPQPVSVSVEVVDLTSDE